MGEISLAQKVCNVTKFHDSSFPVTSPKQMLWGDKLRTCRQQVNDVTGKLLGNCCRGIWP